MQAVDMQPQAFSRGTYNYLRIDPSVPVSTLTTSKNKSGSQMEPL